MRRRTANAAAARRAVVRDAPMKAVLARDGDQIPAPLAVLQKPQHAPRSKLLRPGEAISAALADANRVIAPSNGWQGARICVKFMELKYQ
jgi:hypothetical protein